MTSAVLAAILACEWAAYALLRRKWHPAALLRLAEAADSFAQTADLAAFIAVHVMAAGVGLFFAFMVSTWFKRVLVFVAFTWMTVRPLRFISLLAVVRYAGISPAYILQTVPTPSQTRNSSKHPSLAVGQYRLDTSIEGVTGLTEFSAAEYAIVEREFKGEKDYNAPPVMFLGREWKLQVGTVHGKTYKIAPYLLLGDKAEANAAAMDTLRYCTEKLGKPSEQETGLFIWDTSDGNVILQTGETAEGFSVSLFLTSGSVRRFERK